MVDAAKQLYRDAAESWAQRTWKREVASILLLLWCVWTTYLLMLSSIERMNLAGGIYGIITTAVFTFALGAFGLDAMYKQGIPGANPPTNQVTPTAGVAR